MTPPYANGAASSARRTARALLSEGFNPTIIYPRGVIAPGKTKPEEGKRPMGDAWGIKPITTAQIEDRFRRFPEAGVGICLGPRKGPGGEWIIDLEGDGTAAEESRAALHGGKCPETLGWGSARGGHEIYVVGQPDRLRAVFPALLKVADAGGLDKGSVLKGEKLGLPGLELRIGAEGKQIHSACPPTVGTDGKPRRWNGVKQIAELPDAFYAHLERAAAEERERAAAKKTPSLVLATPAVDQVEAYFRKAVGDEVDKVKATPEGERHNSLRTASWTLAGLRWCEDFDWAGTREALAKVGEGIGLDDDDIAGLLDGAEKRTTDREPEGLLKAIAERDRRRREAESNGKQRPPEGGLAISEAADADREWPPLRLGVLPPAPPFPLDVLPEAAGRLAIEAAASIGCDPGIVAGPMLAAAGGLIGQSARLMLEANRFAGACLFQCNVGLPGDGKTPALMYATDPLIAIERDLDADFQSRKRDYLDKVQKKKGGEEPATPPPVPRRIIIDDATIEAAIRILANNPRGLVLLKDELSAMVLGLNQYKGGKGNDRPNLMKMWAGAPVLIDRVLNEFQEPIRVPHPHLCITGNLPPAMLAELVNPKGDDGFIDRWLFVFPDRLPKLKTAQRRPVSDEAIRDWAAVADRLWGLDLRAHERGPVPHVIRLSAAARSTFESRHDEHVDEVNDPGFPDSLRGPWSKLEAYAGRFTLILARLWDSTGERAPSPEVDQARVRGAWELASYFKDHGRRVRAHLEGRGLGGLPDEAKLILNWVKNHPDATAVTDRDISRSYPPRRGYDPIVMQDGLGWLAERHALRVAPAGPRPEGKPGRPAGATWELHPSLRDRLHNQQNQRNGGCQPGSSRGSADSADSASPPESLSHKGVE